MHSNPKRAVSNTKPVAVDGYVTPMWVAGRYAGLGEVDKMFDWLERDLQERDPSIAYITSIREIDPYRSDPRFRALLDNMGLEIST